MNSSIIYIVLGLALVGLFLWKRFTGVEKGCGESPEPKKLALFYSDKCGPCVAFKPVWEQLKVAHEGDASIVFVEIDVDENPDPRVTGTPMIILDNGGEQFIFKDQRTLDKLEKFIQTAH